MSGEGGGGRTFAALCFTEDENLLGRTYWYESPFPLRAGQEVLAPVGAHNGLQRARVERAVVAAEENAPYDVRLIKKIEAVFGARRLTAGRLICAELGGARADAKRYTRFRRVLVSEFGGAPDEEERAALLAYGVTEIAPVLRAREAIGRLCGKGGCVLLCGAGAYAAGDALLAVVRGERSEYAGISPQVCAAFRRLML